MTCIIIEDQPPAQRILKKYIQDIGSLELLATFSNAIEALTFLQTTPVELIFLDIHLPKISGIDFLKTLSQPPQVILTTAFPDYALEGYELDVADYLLKPFSFQRFVKAVAKVTRMNTPIAATSDSTPDTIFIKSGYEHIKIVVDNIIHIHSDTDYTELHFADKKLLTNEPLRHWLDTLNEQDFIRVHRSYIINLRQIEKIVGGQVYLSAGQVVPIGRAYKEVFLKRVL
ncbi:MAG: LytR/AlgR family response regulator transcription factor [Saprospiraceae bacterium]